MFQIIRDIDRSIFTQINSFHNDFLDFIMWNASGVYIWIPLYLYILYLIFKTDKKQLIITSILMILSVAMANTIASEVLKPLIHRLRPSYVPELADVIHIVKGYKGGTYGFASSHAANSAAIAVWAIYSIRKFWFRITIIAWVCLISYSRIYLGVHYPGDVLAGLLIGIISSILIIIISSKYIKAKTH